MQICFCHLIVVPVECDVSELQIVIAVTDTNTYELFKISSMVCCYVLCNYILVLGPYDL